MILVIFPTVDQTSGTTAGTMALTEILLKTGRVIHLVVSSTDHTRMTMDIYLVWVTTDLVIKVALSRDRHRTTIIVRFLHARTLPHQMRMFSLRMNHHRSLRPLRLPFPLHT